MCFMIVRRDLSLTHSKNSAINVDIPVLRSEIGFNCFAMKLKKRGAYAQATFNLSALALCALREWQ